MTEASRQAFLRSLMASRAGRVEPAASPGLDRTFVRALLEFGSATDDNKQCVERVGIGPGTSFDDAGRVGFRLRRTGTSLADILNAAEGAPVPGQLAEDFPDVTQEDWDAVLRLATLVFVALETPTGPPDDAVGT